MNRHKPSMNSSSMLRAVQSNQQVCYITSFSSGALIAGLLTGKNLHSGLAQYLQETSLKSTNAIDRLSLGLIQQLIDRLFAVVLNEPLKLVLDQVFEVGRCYIVYNQVL